MAEPFVGQIMQVGFDFAPRNWALCDGQPMPVAQNNVLFTLIGTTYGGDGNTTFNLPNLQGRVPVHQGQGPNLTNRVIGAAYGEETHTLIITEMPTHTHSVNANSAANQVDPTNNIWGGDTTGTTALYSNSAPDCQLSSSAIAYNGGSQPHENMQPFVVTTFCISLEGIFPQQS